VFGHGLLDGGVGRYGETFRCFVCMGKHFVNFACFRKGCGRIFIESSSKFLELAFQTAIEEIAIEFLIYLNNRNFRVARTSINTLLIDVDSITRTRKTNENGVRPVKVEYKIAQVETLQSISLLYGTSDEAGIRQNFVFSEQRQKPFCDRTLNSAPFESFILSFPSLKQLLVHFLDNIMNEDSLNSHKAKDEQIEHFQKHTVYSEL
jgi:hypothetical protein